MDRSPAKIINSLRFIDTLRKLVNKAEEEEVEENMTQEKVLDGGKPSARPVDTNIEDEDAHISNSLSRNETILEDNVAEHAAITLKTDRVEQSSDDSRQLNGAEVQPRADDTSIDSEFSIQESDAILTCRNCDEYHDVGRSKTASAGFSTAKNGSTTTLVPDHNDNHRCPEAAKQQTCVSDSDDGMTESSVDSPGESVKVGQERRNSGQVSHPELLHSNWYLWNNYIAMDGDGLKPGHGRSPSNGLVRSPSNGHVDPKIAELLRCLPDNGYCRSNRSNISMANSSPNGKVIEGVEMQSALPLSPTANPDEIALLARLDEANRLLEQDRKSKHRLKVKGHSRQSSITSVVSNTSVSSATSGGQLDEETSPADLWEIWGRVVADWDNLYKKKANYIKELVRRGVPHHFRGIVWQLLCGAADLSLREQYADYLKMTSPSEKMIRRDITRTYPEHEFFKEKNGLGQESLFNVMKAYSLVDREVGYCQGSGFIVGLILMQMPEEEAFAVLVRIMQDYRLRELFKPSMAELGLCMFQLECMIQELLPDLYTHFQSQSFCVSMFASSWFLTLFTTTLPLTTACRVFELFLSEGMEVMFRVGFALLQLTEEELLASDMETMIKFLQKDVGQRVEQEPDLLFATAFNVKYNSRKMKKLHQHDSGPGGPHIPDPAFQLHPKYVRLPQGRHSPPHPAPEDHTSGAPPPAPGPSEDEEDVDVVMEKEGDVPQSPSHHPNVLTNGRLEKEYNTLKSREQEEQVELRRLRTENRLLRQRIDNLEKETATLADRLIQDQVKYAQQEEEMYALRRDMSVARQYRETAAQRLEQVTQQLQEVRERSSMGSASSVSGDISMDEERSKDEEIEQLQRNLAAARYEADESNCIAKELRAKTCELENMNKQLQKEPCQEIQHLQEELIASKLREAEANLSLKELQQRVTELDRHWHKYQDRLASGGGGKLSKDKSQQLHDDLMAIHIREATAISELKEVKLRVMELETKNHICDRQITRQTAENTKLKEELEERDRREKDFNKSVGEFDRKLTDLETKRKEDAMMAKITDAEHAQAIAEMRRRIAELEIENQELVTTGQLQDKGDRQDLLNRIADLQEEVLQLKLARRLQSLSSLALNNVNDESNESDYDTDDIETINDAQRLQLTESMTGVIDMDSLRSAQRLVLDADSSDSEAAVMESVRHKNLRKKKKSMLTKKLHTQSMDMLDLDKTPTQDMINSTELFLRGNLLTSLASAEQSPGEGEDGQLQGDVNSNSTSLPTNGCGVDRIIESNCSQGKATSLNGDIGSPPKIVASPPT